MRPQPATTPMLTVKMIGTFLLDPSSHIFITIAFKSVVFPRLVIGPRPKYLVDMSIVGLIAVDFLTERAIPFINTILFASAA